jgi:ferredoxin-like protein FixX
MAYTGRKLNQYIWIPKSKTYLREYREFLKICGVLEESNGYFNDKTIGQEMVKLRAIVDRDNTADSYIEKYEGKKIGDQSYVSNARMLIRIFRWLGFISKDYDPKLSGRFYLTPYGERFFKYSGPITNEEIGIFRDAFAKMRYFSQNDDINYRNYYFKQRPFYNLIRFLALLEYASHYELALSALVLKNETKQEIEEKLQKILSCRKNKNIRWLMREYGMDCNGKSTVTGIYDGPKVLLSFAKQMGLAEELDLHKKENEGIYNLYKKMYRDSGQISGKSAKKVTKITELGKKFVEYYKDDKLIWFDDLSNPVQQSAVIIFCKKNDFIKAKQLLSIGVAIKILDKQIFSLDKDRILLQKKVSFDLYRDVPYEKRGAVIEALMILDRNILKEKIMVESKQKFIKEVEDSKCKECYYGQCTFYRNKIDSFGGSDRFASRVCPENLLHFNDSGILEIDSANCVGCCLCSLNCPFDAIFYDDKYLFIKNQSKKAGVLLSMDDKKRLTLESEKNKEKNSLIKFKDIPGITNNFIDKINRPGQKWDKDKCYTYVRNAFRVFGVDAIYSGSGGMKTRSDVTILSPFKAVSEIKSPAESPINLKAVRQAVDAAVQAGTNLTMAIGLSTHSGAIDQEQKYFKTVGIGVILLEIKYITFLVALSPFIKFTPDSLKRLISNNRGSFGKENLKKYLYNEIDILRSSINKESLEDVVNKTFF